MFRNAWDRSLQNFRKKVDETRIFGMVEDLVRRSLFFDDSSSMNRIRFATSLANPISWVTTTMAMPSSAKSSSDPRLSDHLGIQSGSRFVKEHDFRVHGQSAYDGDSLLLAAGELSGIALSLVFQPNSLQEHMCFFASVFLRDF